MPVYKFQEGSMWEGYEWEIRTDYKCSGYGGGPPCKHCHSEEIVRHKRIVDDSFYEERTWICPKIVVVLNEGGCNSTGLCLDCLLEKSGEIFGES